MKRRSFLENLAKGTGTLIVLPMVLVACEDDLIDDPSNGNNNNNGDNGTNVLVIDLTDSQYSALATAGGHVVVNNIIIINTGEQFVALSSVCTHSGCQVTYSASGGNLPCPCHGSLFSISGSVLNGPANSPLATYPVTQEGDILNIDRG
jgi:cytochrome b6-f complex iron-sulfur subunit